VFFVQWPGVPVVRGGATFEALPIPLGSLIELLLPPTLPGPGGIPLTPVVPAPADPAFGVPAGLPEVAAPFVTCANELAGTIRTAMIASATILGIFRMGLSPIGVPTTKALDILFPAGFPRHRFRLAPGDWRYPRAKPGKPSAWLASEAGILPLTSSESYLAYIGDQTIIDTKDESLRQAAAQEGLERASRPGECDYYRRHPEAAAAARRAAAEASVKH
jgi:hypothetical protein